MSVYRVDGGAKVGGAHRPWGTEASPDTSQPLIKETEEMRAEREACLACPLPECNPYLSSCPVRNRRKGPRQKAGRKKLEPPAVFVKYGRSSTSNREWAEHLGVSVTTILNWRRELGYQRIEKGGGNGDPAGRGG